MQMWEARRFVAGVFRRHRTQWETARQLGFWNLASMGAKVSSPKDLLDFSWEKPMEISEDEIAELQEIIRQENEKIEKNR